MDVASAISLLFEGCRVRPRAETAWVEEVLKRADVSDEQLDEKIRLSLAIYCPNLPDESMSVVVNVLRSAVRSLQREER